MAGNPGLAGSDTGCVPDRHTTFADGAGDARHPDAGAQVHIIRQIGEYDETHVAVTVGNAG